MTGKEKSQETPAELFRRLDSDGSGWLDVRELREALATGGFNYDLHTVQALMRLFTGRLLNTALNETQFNALHEWLIDIMSKYSAALSPGATGLSREAAKSALSQILRIESERLGVKSAHCVLDEQAFNAFLDSSDPDADLNIDGPEFVHAAVSLKGLISVFRAFGGNASDGKVHLTFSQLLFAAAHII